MLELINIDRAKVGAQPLAFNDALNQSAEDHSNWILSTDTFSHRGVDGSSPGDRMAAAGYDFSGDSASAENIAGLSTRTPDELQDEVQQMHNMLMNSPGHRTNVLNNTFREIGVGVETGKFRVYDVALVTQNFARTISDSFLLGIISRDQDSDKRYDIGEGLAGVTVSAKNNETDAIVTTTTNEGGGYDLELVNGTYTVSFTGSDFATTSLQAIINSKNVKLDLINPDTISNNTSTPDPVPAPIPPVIEPTPSEPELNTITGTARSDFLRGTSEDDEILGLDGRDRLFGFDGDDHINGGGGSDIIFGGAGADILTGGTDRDYFVFNTPFDNTIDTITDFEAVDFLVLDNEIFTGLRAGRLNDSAFHNGAEAQDATDHVIYNTETGALYFDVDAAGGADAVQFVQLTAGLALSNTDIFII